MFNWFKIGGVTPILKQHSNFLAVTPTIACELRSHFVYLKSGKNFRSVEYSKLKFRSVEKKLYVLQDFFSYVNNLVADVFSGLFVGLLLIFMIYEKMCFLWRDYSSLNLSID